MVQKNDQERLEEIEATQAELRDSIERSRDLSEKAQQLLDAHRRKLADGD